MKQTILVTGLIATTLTLWIPAIHSQGLPAPRADRVGYPTGYETRYRHLYTVDRPDSGQIRSIWGNEKAASAVFAARHGPSRSGVFPSRGTFFHSGKGKS